MEDFRRQIYDDFATGIVGKRDNQIRLAINAALGHDQWMLSDLEGRVRREICAGVETYILDDKPILEIHPPQFELSEDGRMMTAKWNIRNLA